MVAHAVVRDQQSVDSGKVACIKCLVAMAPIKRRSWIQSRVGKAAIALCLAFGSPAQEQPRIAFEIASVRPSPPEGTPGRSTGLQGTHYESHGNTLRLLIVTAYDTLPHQLVTPVSSSAIHFAP